MGKHQTNIQSSEIHNPKIIRLLYISCWIVYFISYVGRLNYAACMVEIGDDMGYGTTALGMISSVIFASYGMGQIFSGFLGDHVSPRLMVFTGVVISAVCNLLISCYGQFSVMVVMLGINGLAQSLIWSPMLRLFSKYVPPRERYQILVRIQSSCALGTCFTYVLTAWIVSIRSWQTIFLIAGVLLLATGVWWMSAISKVECYASLHASPSKPVCSEPSPDVRLGTSAKLRPLFLSSGLLLIILPTLVMGMLRDGIMTWVPEYTARNFGASNAMSIFLTAFLPLLNLIGAYAVAPIYKKFSNEIIVALIMFVTAGCAIALLMICGNMSLILTILLFSIVTSAMTGCNTAIISMIPTVFIKWNRTSTVVGILNGCCYAGSALSGFVIGILSEKAGWKLVQFLWLILCAAAVVLCITVSSRWNTFKKTQQT